MTLRSIHLRPLRSAPESDPVRATARAAHPAGHPTGALIEPASTNVLVLPIDKLDVITIPTLRYAAQVGRRETYVVHVADSDEAACQFVDRWTALKLHSWGLRLYVVETPPWSVADTLSHTIREIAERPGAQVAVLVTPRSTAGRATGRSATRQALDQLAGDTGNVTIGEFRARSSR